MEFNPFDMFGGDRHPFPFRQRRTQNQPSFPNSQTDPQMHDNSWWGWPFEVPGHESRNDTNANYRRHSTHPPPSKPTSCRTNAHPAKKNAEATTSRKGRVISIPVYDGTESQSASTRAKAAGPRMEQGVAAMKIQSTFRGFCVRKSKPLEKLRIICQVKSEADEIGKHLATQTHLIRGNEYECLKLDHQIMSLLLRLDAIQGVKSFVRESKKAVCRLVFQLQETVDAIIAANSISIEGAGETDHEHIPEMDSHSQSNPMNGTPELSPEKEEVMKKSENRDKCTADCERDTCELELNGLDLSPSDTVPANGEQHIGDRSIQCDEACDGHVISKGLAVDRMENETLQKVLADLCRKVESSDKLINDLSIRVAQLERQISEDDDKDTDTCY